MEASEYRNKVRECVEKAMAQKGPARHAMLFQSRGWSTLAQEKEGFDTLLSEWGDQPSKAEQQQKPD
jgi:hypothetical protein